MYQLSSYIETQLNNLHVHSLHIRKPARDRLITACDSRNSLIEF